MNRILIILLLVSAAIPAMTAQDVAGDSRKARNYVVEGNKQFRDARYADAEVLYRKALENDEIYDVAKFNLAATLLRQDSPSPKQVEEASTLLYDLATSEVTSDKLIEKSLYNLGNLAFSNNNYQASIDFYKKALRKNPDNDQARENLYLAQKMLQQQQNQDQNKDQDKKDQQQKEQEQQQQQDQQQNQDKKDDNKDQQPPKQDEQKQNPPQPNQISPENAEQILKAMEKEENATRARIEKENSERNKANARRRPVTNPW